METTYRKVLVTERLPKEFGMYLTTRGWRLFQDKTKEFEEPEKHKGGGDEPYPDLAWWLEEIELPTDKIIEFESKKEEIDKGLSIMMRVSWEFGAKWMRNFVLAATPK